MKLTVLGPNLRDQSKGIFHVHAAGCRDIARYQTNETETNEWGSLEALVTDYYSNQIAESGGSWDEYAPDFYVLPCAADLEERDPVRLFTEPDHRVERAGIAIAAYLEAEGGDPDDWGDTVTDLLTDLRHAARRYAPEFPGLVDRCVERSAEHFDAEL